MPRPRCCGCCTALQFIKQPSWRRGLRKPPGLHRGTVQRQRTAARPVPARLCTPARPPLHHHPLWRRGRAALRQCASVSPLDKPFRPTHPRPTVAQGGDVQEGQRAVLQPKRALSRLPPVQLCCCGEHAAAAPVALRGRSSAALSGGGVGQRAKPPALVSQEGAEGGGASSCCRARTRQPRPCRHPPNSRTVQPQPRSQPHMLVAEQRQVLTPQDERAHPRGVAKQLVEAAIQNAGKGAGQGVSGGLRARTPALQVLVQPPPEPPAVAAMGSWSLAVRLIPPAGQLEAGLTSSPQSRASPQVHKVGGSLRQVEAVGGHKGGRIQQHLQAAGGEAGVSQASPTWVRAAAAKCTPGAHAAFAMPSHFSSCCAAAMQAEPLSRTFHTCVALERACTRSTQDSG